MTDKKDGQNDGKPRNPKKVDKPPADPHREYLDMDTDEEEYGRQETPEPEEEEAPEPEKPVFTDKELNKIVEYVKDFTILSALSEKHWNEQCYEVIREYFRDPTKIVLTIFYDVDILTALLDFPCDAVDGLTYFLRSPWQVYTAENFHSTIIFGSVNGNVENTILNVLQNIYAPILFASDEWPKTIKDDVCSNMHAFLINLTETTYKLMGLTVLYIPREGLDIERSKPPHESQFILLEEDEDKELENVQDDEGELVGRLERVAHFWIKQIREALANTNAASDLNSIMDELSLWNYRYDNLCGLHCQLRNKNILCIVEKLENVQSESVRQFQRLSADVERAIEEATTNITYLSLLIEPCNTLAAPDGIEEHVAKILHILRFIWLDSPFYNSTNRIETLCQALSTQVIRQCRDYVDLNVIFQGDTDKGRCMLQTCISSCLEYKAIYDRLVAATPDISPGKRWGLNRDNVLNNVDAFIQRCRDVIEICDAMVVFGRSDQMRNFGGSKGIEHGEYCLRIERLFYENLERIENVYDKILDVTDCDWMDHMTGFRHQMTELEVKVRNLVEDIFKDTATIEEGIEALYALQRFNQRQCLKETLHIKWVEVWKIFNKELENSKLIMIDESNARHSSMPYYSGRATILRIRKNRLIEQQTRMINASDWLGDCDSQISILRTYKKLIAAIMTEEKILFETWEKGIREEKDLSDMLNEPLLRPSKTKFGPIDVNMDEHLLVTIEEAEGWDALKYDVKPYVKKISSKRLILKSRYDGAISLCMSYNKIIKCLSGEARLLFKELLKNVDNVISPGFEKTTWNCDFAEKYYDECASAISNCQEFVNLYKQANSSINGLIEKISDVRFVTITEDVTYRFEGFVSYLAKGRESGIAEIMQYQNAILRLVLGMREGFNEHLDKIMKYWCNYVEAVDCRLEKTLLFSTQRSLRECLRFFYGDGITIPEPLLRIQADYTDNKIIFNPEIREIQEIVENMYNSMVTAVQSISRISRKLKHKSKSKEFWETIGQNDACFGLQNQITEEMVQANELIIEYLQSIECIKEISEIDNEINVEKYADAVSNRETLEADMLRCTKLTDSVQTISDVIRARFIEVDLRRLKSKIIESCETWKEILCIELSKVIATEQTSDTTSSTPSEELSSYSYNMATYDN